MAGAAALALDADRRHQVPALPDDVRAAARRAFETRDRDVVLAEIAYDSLDDESAAPAAARVVRFEVDGAAALEMVVDAAPGGDPVVDVRAVAADLRLVGVRTPDGPLDVAPAGASPWRVGAGRGTLLSLTFESPRGRVRTAWVRVYQEPGPGQLTRGPARAEDPGDPTAAGRRPA